MAPLTRCRSTSKGHVPIVELMAEYYSQRGSTEGTLIITEATFIAERAGGFDSVPGIWDEEQISAWKKVLRPLWFP
jgi:NADPH2 dehydrogenase